MTVRFCLYRDRATDQLQLAIEDGEGDYRFFGPKFLGQSELLRDVTVTERDAREIRRYINKVAK